MLARVAAVDSDVKLDSPEGKIDLGGEILVKAGVGGAGVMLKDKEGFLGGSDIGPAELVSLEEEEGVVFESLNPKCGRLKDAESFKLPSPTLLIPKDF